MSRLFRMRWLSGDRALTIDGQFAYTHATRTFSKATPAEINRLLQLQALDQYGDKVDAVINVTYDSNPRNDVFGTGLAVHFVEGRARRT